MVESRFPYLFEVAGQRRYPLGGRSQLRFGGAEQADVRLDGCADDQLAFCIERGDGQWLLSPLSDRIALSVNQVPVRQTVALQHLAIIQAGGQLFIFIEHDDPSVSTSFATGQWLIQQILRAPRPEVGTRDTIEATWDAAAPPRPDTVPLELPGSIELPERQVLIGRDRRWVDICLPDVRVSRVHAWIAREGNQATITDLNSANGTFVGGRRIHAAERLVEGESIQIGPYKLVFTGTALYPLSHDNDVQLVGRELVRRVPDRRRRGRLKVILDHVSVVVPPRHFVCIVGPSGSGKTTLLAALSGRVPADEGSVLLNGDDLYANFEALKQNLAVVPQKDVLHDVLPLNVALYYTARLRLPADLPRQELENRIDEMLDSVNLAQHQFTPIRRLSGGQVKRASWVNEAICNPSLIFLDEVTSGLDEQTDCEMMQLFRRMADAGKTIICVTHSVTYVEQNCHLVVVLASGGVLAFVGPPEGALEYFGISRLGDVYQRLKQQPPDRWQRQFRQSEWYEKYVARPMPPVVAHAAPPPAPRRRPLRDAAALLRELWLLVRRYMAIMWADKRALAMLAGQCVFIAALLVWLFGNLAHLNVEEDARRMVEIAVPGVAWHELLPETQQEFLTEAREKKLADYSAKILYLLCISCIWFGCNNAAKEIVKERNIYSKERDVGLHVVSYYGSKLLLLGAISVLQATLLYWSVRHFTELGGDGRHQWLLLCLSSLAGVAIGLAISALARTEDVAATIVPISLIPQIILAGLIAPLLSYTRVFSQLFISAYWAYQGLLGQLDSNLQWRLRDAGSLDLAEHWTLGHISSILVAHVLLLALAALAALYLRDRHANGQLRLFSRRAARRRR